MGYNICVGDSYNEERVELHKLLDQVGSNICFDENIWVCDKKKRSNHQKGLSYTIYFSKIPLFYLESVKYFILIRFKHNLSIATIMNNVTLLSPFLKFITEKFGNIKLINFNDSCSYQYKLYLDSIYDNEITKAAMWTNVKVFFKTLKGWPEVPVSNPFGDNPYIREYRLDVKLIPEIIEKKLDLVFKDERIPLHQRLTYWLLRCIPSRINEICAMKIDCIKPFNGHFVIFIPTTKEDGGYKEPEIRHIHIEDVGMGKYLMDLIRKQQKIARKLQRNIEAKNLLFTYYGTKLSAIKYEKTGEIVFFKKNKVYCSDNGSFGRFLHRVCEIFYIRDENGEIYFVNSHQFRHNGITDRLQKGFTIEQIRDMTRQQGDAAIIGAYNHLNLRPEVIQERQKKVIEKRNDESRPVYFRGRILNLEDEVSNRILRNIRAHKVRGGLCRDIINCKSKMFACLDCELQIDDADDLSYFEEQVTMWKEKLNNFREYPMMSKVAKYNYELHLRHANNIKLFIKGVENNEKTSSKT